jgi:uncharacterized MAPEG superfamily protein
MRGVFFVGMVVVLLIVGVLVIKNMGRDSSGGDTAAQSRSYIEKAQGVAGKADQRVKALERKIGEKD